MLRSIIKINDSKSNYPNNVLDFSTLDLDAPIIFLTGENGSGKSTLLSMIATLSESINLGHYDKQIDSSNYRLTWSNKLRKGYYFQSEDFYLYL